MAEKTELRLPRNRFQEFRYVIKQWDKMLALSLFVALFALPLVALLYVSAVAEASLLEKYSGTQYLAQVISLRITTALISPLGFYLLILALQGAFYFIRRRVWGQGSSLVQDFFKGVRTSFVASILPALLSSLTFLFFVSAVWFVPIAVTDTILQIVAYLAVALVVTLTVSATMFDIAQNAIYKISVFQRLKNSFIFALSKFPKNFLVVLATFAPFAFTLVWTVLGVVVSFTLMALYWFGGSVLLQTLYCHSVFDKYINAKSYPDLVRKGLAKEEE